jgi:hypothetical protein
MEPIERRPRLSRRDFNEALRYYREGHDLGMLPANSGSGRKNALTHAGTLLGLHPQTIRDRLSWGVYFGVPVPGLTPEGMPEYDPKPALARKAEGYIPPVLPSFEAPIEDQMALAIREFERRRAAEKARLWMPYAVEGEAPFCLVYVGDPHVDDPHTDLATLGRHVSIIKQTDRMWAIGMGDYVNGWIGRLTRKYADQGITERGAYGLAKWLFSQDIWWMLIKGNHDAWKGGGNPLDWMLDEAATPVVEWQAQFTVLAAGQEWKVWAAHDFPGNSQWNILHGPLKRAMMTGGAADLFVCGDKHCYGVLHTQHEHTGRPYWVARARGYKMQDDYARQCGYGEMTMGHSIAAVHDPRDGKMVCFDDVEVAAQYLEFLKGQRK